MSAYASFNAAVCVTRRRVTAVTKPSQLHGSRQGVRASRQQVVECVAVTPSDDAGRRAATHIVVVVVVVVVVVIVVVVYC